jgi:hypothetical protein
LGFNVVATAQFDEGQFLNATKLPRKVFRSSTCAHYSYIRVHVKGAGLLLRRGEQSPQAGAIICRSGDCFVCVDVVLENAQAFGLGGVFGTCQLEFD